MRDVDRALADVVDSYPVDLRPLQRSDVARQWYLLETLQGLASPGAAVVDLGGGVGMFSVLCAALGYDATVVDDNQDAVNRAYGDDAHLPHRQFGVKVVERDVIADGLPWPDPAFDVVTCFDSMEHWHASPKGLFAQVMQALRPNGWFFLGVPNGLNLRKRIEVPLGRAKWSQMADWYEQPVFRGHVREPDVDDLRYIAEDMGLVDARIEGRNWLGLQSPRAQVARAARHIDVPLRHLPQLCSDIYLIGRRPRR